MSSTDRWKVTFYMDVDCGRDPRIWDWDEIIDVADETDSLVEDSVTLEYVPEVKCPTCNGSGNAGSAFDPESCGSCRGTGWGYPE